MKRSIFRVGSLLCGSAALLTLAGCPDAPASRGPQMSAQITRIQAEIDGLQARTTALEGREEQRLAALQARLSALEGRVAQNPVNINHNYYGEGAAKPPAGAAPAARQPAEGPKAQDGAETQGKTDEVGQGEQSPKQPGAPEVALSEVKPPQGQGGRLAHRPGYDSWNELNPPTLGEKPRKGGRVRVHLSSQPDKLNTYLDNSAVTSYILNGYLFESLIDQDPETFEWKPLLAESWTAEDMLYEIKGSEAISDVAFSDSMQKWVRNEGQDDQQVWWPWEIRKTAGGFELLELAEHMGMAKQTMTGWTLEPLAGETKTFPAAQVAKVNKGTVFTFKLRKGVTFHDGKPLTADDVVFTIAAIKSPYVDAPSIRSYYEDVRPAEKLDSHTVRIVYEKQYFQALEFAGGVYIHPKHVYDPENLLQNDPQKFGEQFNKNPIHRQPIGSGPYRFESWKQQDNVTVKRFDGYWNPERNGYLDTIQWVFIDDPQTALASLRAGDIDFLPRLSSEQFFKETDTPAFKSKFVKPVFYYGNFSYVGWNLRRPPFNDLKVRQALGHGFLDVQAFIDNVLYGAAVRVGGPQYIYGPMYDQDMPLLNFDLKQARKLLREAGWFDRDGDGIIENADRMPFTFEMLMPSGSSTGKQMMAVASENLKSLGIKLEIRELEWAVFIENISSRQFDACSLGWVQGLESDPFQIWHSSNSENRGSNHVGFMNPQADELILKLRETLDKGKRKALNTQLQRLIYEQQPYFFLFCSPDKGAYLPKYHGVRFIPFRPGYDLREWYVTEGEK